MTDDTELEVQVEVAPDTDDTVTKVETTKGQDPGEDLAAQFKKLQDHQAAEQQRANDRIRAAEERANKAAQEASQARRQAQLSRVNEVDSQYDTIASGIAAANAEISQGEQAYTKAMEEGNWAAASKAQSAVSIASAKLVRLDEAKADLEVRKQIEQQRLNQPQREQQREVPSDPVEAYIAQAERPPRTQQWLREHRDYITDPRKQMKLNAAHNDALAEGFEANSDDYFGHVEKFLGFTKAPAPPPSNGRKQPPVAPVNGGSGNGNSVTGANVVRLTPGEAKSATDGTLVWNYDDPSGKGKFKRGDPIGIQEMARRKQALQVNGQYDKSYYES